MNLNAKLVYWADILGQVMQRVQTTNNVVPYVVTLQCEMEYTNTTMYMLRSAEQLASAPPSIRVLRCVHRSKRVSAHNIKV